MDPHQDLPGPSREWGTLPRWEVTTAVVVGELLPGTFLGFQALALALDHGSHRPSLCCMSVPLSVCQRSCPRGALPCSGEKLPGPTPGLCPWPQPTAGSPHSLPHAQMEMQPTLLL